MEKLISPPIQHFLIQTANSLSTNRKFWQSGLLFIFAAIFIALSLAKPKMEWDMIPYTAHAMNMIQERPIDQLRIDVYEELKASVPAESYARLTSTENHRDIIAADTEAFHQHITFFYDTRVVYIGMIAGAIKLGIEPFKATYLISTLAAVLAMVLLAFLIPLHLPYGLLLSILPIALVNGLFLVARYSTPDALAALVSILMYWCLLRNKSILLLLMPLCILIRTDLIILVVFFIAYLFYSKRFSKTSIFLSGILTVLSYIMISYVVLKHDAWSSVIGYNYHEKPIYAQDYVFDVTPSVYIDILRQGLASLSYQPEFFVFIVMLISGVSLFASQLFCYRHNQNKVINDLHKDILFTLVSCAGYVAAHIILFPEPWLRFFAAQYCIVMTVVIWSSMVSVRKLLPEKEEATEPAQTLEHTQVAEPTQHI